MADPKQSPEVLASNHGKSPLDAARTIAFSAVAAGPSVLGKATLEITTTTTNLRKHMCVYIASGTYAGVHRIAKVLSSTKILIWTDIAFVATASGSLVLSAHLEGFGFWVDVAPVTIAELTPWNSNDDTAGAIATTYIAGVYYPMDFKKIRISAGKITVVRRPPPSPHLTFTNR